MRVIAKSTLRQYWSKRPDAESALKAWHSEVKAAQWNSPAELKAKYGSASVLKRGRVIFNICGGKHRLVTWINFDFKIVYVRFIGTHNEYDKIDAENI